ncbi:restriction endonuclease subunit S [Bilifractor sp. LCP21S3_A7]|uniref:restriction endonuclease subunit S n=1 Tax=Bilifractor sp. LCP21S3_A7 TaxID=3438738 RepID=UPI003F93146F
MNKRKTPAIRFKGYQNDWEQRKVGELTNVLSASRVHKEEWAEDGIPFFRSSDVVSAFKGTENKKAFISIELYEQLAKSSGKLEKNDILITGGGSIGIPYIVPDNKPLYSKDADLIWIKHSANFDSRYLYTYFISEEFREYLASISHMGTIPHYTIEQVKDTPVRLPSIDEQRELGDFFVSLDHLITLHQRKLEKLKILKKTMLENCFPQKGESVPRVRFGGFTGDWEQRKLADVAEIIGGGTPSTSNPDYWDGDIDWYAPVEIGEQIFAYGSVRKITKEGLIHSSAKILPAHKTVLFTSRAGIGNMAILKRPAATNQGFQSLVCHDDIDPYFMFSMGDSIKVKAERVAAGSTFAEISGKKLGELEFMFPDTDEQKAISVYFKNLDHLITLHQCKMEKLQTIKKSLLRSMFV